MRHGKKLNSLGRKSAHRSAMLANMSVSLIEHKRITTTVAKAKALRVYLEPLLTKAKTDSTHTRRVVFSYLQDKDAITELFREIAPKIADRPGGYLRIIRLGNRLGDNAEMCMVELVDFNELMVKEPKEKRTRRSRRGGGGGGGGGTSAKATETKTGDKKETAKENAPKKEATKADATKKAAPKKEATAKKEAPKKEATPKKAETTKKADTPKKAETPKKEAPKKEAPKKEAPKAEDKKSDDKKE